MNAWLILLLLHMGAVDEFIGQRRYLDAAMLLKSEIAEHPDPILIREYTVLVVEKYVTQLEFRVFFLANLTDGTSPRMFRGKDESLVSSRDKNLVEQNLEGLLIMGRDLFPESLELEFAVAFYTLMGSGLLDRPRLKMDAKTRLDVFRRAEEQGIVAARSLYALAQAEMAQEQSNRQKVTQDLARAFALDPEDPDIGATYLEYLLDRRQYADALPIAQQILDGAEVLEQRLIGLHGAAQAFLGLGDVDRALKAVDIGLRLVPEHVFLWMIGLDALRQKLDSAAYAAMVDRFVDRDPEDPRSFALYLAYLRKNSVTDLDRIFMSDYAAREPKTPLAAITHRYNLATFAIEEKQFERAMEWLTQARKMAQALPGDTATLLESLDSAIQAAEKGTAP